MTRAVLSGVAVEYHAPEGVPGLVRDAAAANPDAVALQARAECVTYRDLVRQTDALAARLAVLGPGRVALAIPRGPQLSVAALACLQAGRAFVPFGEDEPEERLAAMLRVAAPTTLVTTRPPAVRPGPLRDLPAVEVPVAGAGPAPRRPHDAAAEAYVLFTSGSTGTPKGVSVGHGALVNRLLWAQDVWSLGPGDTVLQKTPCTFDVALWELLWPLAAGARIWSLPPGAHRDPGEIVEAITRERVTLCHFVPSMLAEFVRWPGADACTGLRHVLCSGEPLPPPLVREFGGVLRARLHNLYGPTEAAIDVTHWEVPPPLEACARMAIGRPVSNTTLYVVDGGLRVVEAGEVGELCIAGVQLADGYVADGAQTAAAFRTLPEEPVRVYRTGDLVRLQGEELEYVGRVDDQVKVRGVRVELGEVEHALAAHPGVRDASAVVADGELVAFVVVEGDPGDLRAEVRRRLPEAFVPSRVHAVAELPLTASGKRDRRRLRELAAELRERDAAAPPGDDVAAAWRAALGPAARPEGGFLDLGGHSLGAARLAGSLLGSRGYRVPMGWLIKDNVSLAELRRRLRVHEERPAPAAATGRAPLSPDQRRLWLIERIHGTLTPYNVAGGIAVPRPLDPGRLGAALDALVQRHEALRVRLVPTPQGGAEQELLPRVERPLAVVKAPAWDLDGRLRRAVDELRRRPLPSDRAPLFALTLLRAGDRSGLAFAASHLICDQQSIEVLWRELLELHDGRELAPAPGYLAGVDRRLEASGRHLDRWVAQLRGAPQALRLPFQRPRPERQSFRGHTASREVDAAAIEGRARELGVAPSALLLHAFAEVLAAWSGQEEVVVGVPADGRADVDEANMIGFFVDTLPVRLRPADPPAATHARLRADVAHGGVAFEDLARALRAVRHPARNPLFQAWFNDLSAYEPAWPAVRASSPPALFDACLYVYRADGRLKLDLTVAADLFDERVAAALADALLRALDPGRSPVPVPLPPPSPHAGEGVAGLVRRFRAVDPARVAIRDGAEDVTYGELAARAGAVAAGPGPLRIAARRSVELAATVLAAWAAATPVALLDARMPEGYLRAPLPDVGPETSHLLATSGTSGEPKLVCVPGRAFAAALLDYAELLGVSPDDRFAVLAGAAHDPVFRDLLLPLVVGARTAIPPDSAFADPTLLWRYLRAERPTVLHMTPARANLLAAAALGGALDSVRAVVLGGDAFPQALLPRLRAAFPAAALFNAYGTTEVPQIASLHPCPPGPDGDVYVPVGTGMGSRRLVVVRDGAPAGRGELGEIGVVDALPPARLAGGPLRTAELDGRTVVLTGDRGRVGLDGAVAWCGRTDRQLSIGGHRVEPDEVERRMREEGDLAAALVAPDGGGLIAWVVLGPTLARLPHDDVEERLAGLQERLRATLPPWSVPTAVHAVPRIVTDRNGKPDAEATAALRRTAPPRRPGAVEELVDRHVRRLLPAGAALTPRTNFFEAGLDSLALLRLHAELRAAGFAQLDPTDLFRWPNVRALAAGLGGATRDRDRDDEEDLPWQTRR
jgi:amino acid adenylation domain-containing protein